MAPALKKHFGPLTLKERNGMFGHIIVNKTPHIAGQRMQNTGERI